MTTLVLFAHADPTATPPFYAEVAAAYDVEIRFFVSHFKGESKAYDQLASKLAKSGPLLAAVAEYAGASKPLAEYDCVLLASWSAGYALVRAILAEPAPDVASVPIRGWIAIDSGYGEPWPAIVELAAVAQAGNALFFAGHTEIATAGYLSSGDSLKAVIAAVGEPRGRFRVEDWGGTTAADHVAALHVHGPELLGDALYEIGVPRRDAVAPTDPAPPTPRSTGGTALDALAVAVAQLGATDAPRFLAGCQRAGKPLGLTSGNWCAAFVGWCDHAAGASWAWRAAVSELWFDALATERAHPLGDGYAPKPGDLAIFGRDGDDPRTGGHGHVGRVERHAAPGLEYTTIEGNHEGGVARVEHTIGSGLSLLGWIER